MILIMHIIIALASILFASYLIFRPSSKGIRFSYGLIIGVLLTGFELVIFMQAPILKTCVSGLVFISVIMGELLIARKRLAQQRN